MTSIKLVLKEQLSNTASRDSGAILRTLILEHLKNHSPLEIDFTDVTLTPSFADEAFGLLCHEITPQALFEQVKFSNLSATHKALLIRVMGNRAQNPLR
jgi:hypothetical protein